MKFSMIRLTETHDGKRVIDANHSRDLESNEHGVVATEGASVRLYPWGNIMVAEIAQEKKGKK